MLKDESHDYYLDDLMNEIAEKLSDGRPKDAADGLRDLASYFARAGMPIESFFNIRKHLIDQAREKAGCPVFIDEQLKLAEQELAKARTGESSSIIIH